MSDECDDLPKGIFLPEKMLTCLQLAVEEPEIFTGRIYPEMLDGSAWYDSRILRRSIKRFAKGINEGNSYGWTADFFPSLIFISIVELPGFLMAGCIGEAALKVYLYELLRVVYYEKDRDSSMAWEEMVQQQYDEIIKQQVELIVAKVRSVSGLPFRFDALAAYQVHGLWDDYEALKAEMELWIRPGEQSNEDS